jgi:hypothetical protein
VKITLPGLPKEYSADCVGTRVASSIIETNVARSRIRSLPGIDRSSRTHHAPSRSTLQGVRHAPTSLIASQSRVDARARFSKRNAGKISACRNFEVEHEHPIFDLRMLSDEA